MSAEEYLEMALGGNMNISTLKPLAWYEIMEGYAKHYHLFQQSEPESEGGYQIALAVYREFCRETEYEISDVFQQYCISRASKEQPEQPDKPCSTCGGFGKLVDRTPYYECPACKGSTDTESPACPDQ